MAHTKVPIHKIKKITVNKNDEVAPVVEKIIDADAKEVVLSVPRFSKLADSLANFHLIKRESQLLRKKIIIESVDDKVVELAGVAGLESLNPILSKSRRRTSGSRMDIVSPRSNKEEVEETTVKTKKLIESVKKSIPKGKPPRFNIRKLVWAGTAIFVLIVFAYLATAVLPRAEIKIVAAKSTWAYNDSAKAEKLALPDSETMTVPAQIFTQQDSLSLSFPASGKKLVERKASGTMTIYNAYSSDPQPLVATTRFLTPDGKLYRLAKSITVPGAKIVEGKIIPSTLEAEVASDKPGDEFNIGPINYYSIPGFKGSPKYQAFYGESKGNMTGGFVGEVAFPTDGDIAKAEREISKEIKSLLTNQLVQQIPEGFNIVEGATDFEMIDQAVITEVDGNNQFSVVADAEAMVIAFKEQELVSTLENKIQTEEDAQLEIKEYEIEYGVARANFNTGSLSFPIDFSAIVAKKIDVVSLLEEVKGKSEESLKSLIYSIPDLESAVISLWPFWVNSVPNNEAKISITVD